MSTTTVDPTTELDARVDVRAEVHRIRVALGTLAPEVVPERIPAHRLAVINRDLGRIERTAAGMRLVLAKAVADTGAWKRSGARSPEEHAAKQNGTSVGKERADLKASERLGDLPATREAAASGTLSPEKTKAVVEGATADPGVEGSLLELAANGDLADVRDEARRTRQRVDERDGKAAERMHARRALRMWFEADGEGRGLWNMPPDRQAYVLAALEPYRDEAYRLACESGETWSNEALMADAMFMLCKDVISDFNLPEPDTGDGDASPSTPNPQPTTDTGDFTNESQETAPTAADTSANGRGADAHNTPANRTASDAPSGDGTLFDEDNDDNGRSRDAAGRHDAAATIGSAKDSDPPNQPAAEPARPSHRGPQPGNRRAPAQIYIHADYHALLRGYPLEGEMCDIVGVGPVPVALVRHMMDDCVLRLILTGEDVTVISSDRRYIPAALERALEARDQVCVVPGCHCRYGLEIDHTHDFALGGPTSLDNTARLCTLHHRLKTYHGWKLTRTADGWEFKPP